MQDSALSEIANKLRQFCAERNWEQFHSPRNLATALSVEAAELLEHFQWSTDEESQAISREKHDQISLELADILIYLVRISDRLNIDLIQATHRKIEINSKRYPVELARGSSKKYTDF